MNKSLRVVALAALFLGLSACNMLVSKEPWFAAAEGQRFPAMRDGLWLSAADDCRVDERKPVERWPDCADASFVRGEEHWSMNWDDVDARGRHRRTFAGWELGELEDGTLLVANGDHLIVQSRTRTEPPPEGPGEADEADPDADPDPVGYVYSALRVLSRDEAGKAMAMTYWSVQCGPLSKPELTPAQRRRLRDDPGAAEERHDVTDHPFPGLTVVDRNCVADSVAAVRNAAALSEALAPPSRIRWVREGWH